MLSSVEQAFVGRDEKQAPLKTPAWEANTGPDCPIFSTKLFLRLLIALSHSFRQTM